MTIEEAAKLRTACEQEIRTLLNELIKSTGLQLGSCDIRMRETISGTDVADYRINMKL